MVNMLRVVPVFRPVRTGKIIRSICRVARQFANARLGGQPPDPEVDSAFDKLDTNYFQFFTKEVLRYPRKAMHIIRVTLRIMCPGDQGPPVPQGNTPVLEFPGDVAPVFPTAMGLASSDEETFFIEQSKPRYIRQYIDKTPPYHFDDHTNPAKGSFGIVRKATSEHTGDVVAIKSISHEYDQEILQQIAHEIDAIQVCKHPNLIQLIDVYAKPGDTVHLVLWPWAPYTLQLFLTQSTNNLSESCSWFKPGQQASMDIVLGILCGLAEGLHYLHQMSIKHKDIKPENILLYPEASGDVRPIITDFGTSKRYEPGMPTKYIDSTNVYLAPEQIDCKSSNLKSDVWQMGCCFAMILTRACGGCGATLKLNDAYENTKDGRSCTIAKELDHFLPAFRELCASMPDVLELTCGMLEEDPAMRWTIERVRDELDRAVEERLRSRS